MCMRELSVAVVVLNVATVKPSCYGLRIRAQSDDGTFSGLGTEGAGGWVENGPALHEASEAVLFETDG